MRDAVGHSAIRLSSLFGASFVASAATFAQVLAPLKLALLGSFLLTAAVDVSLRPRKIIYPRIIWFYAVIGLVGIAWSIVGLWRTENYLMGVVDSLRLYFVWSMAFVLIYGLLRASTSLKTLHLGLLMAGIAIPLVNFVGIADQVFGWGLIGPDLRLDMQLTAGFLDGYIRLNSINLGSLFVIVAYFLALEFAPEQGNPRSIFTRLALILGLVTVVVSGRRALWLAIALAPFVIFAVLLLTRTLHLVSARRRRLLGAYCVLMIAAPVVAPSLVPGFEDIPAVQHLRAGFSAEDERSIQSEYLLNGWARNPLFGSGFGAYAGYQRNVLRPWTYELTYHRMLYNLGLVGMSVLVALFATYFAFVLHGIRQERDSPSIPIGLVVGFICMLIGAYSNPYFGSFDFLLFVGLLPYLSTRPQSARSTVLVPNPT